MTKRIAVVCLPGLTSFIEPVAEELKKENEVKTCYSGKSEELTEVIQWADTVWIEWGNELAVALTQSNLLDGKHTILRIHSYEALSGYAIQIQWNKLDDVIFVATHIRDLIFQQIALSNKVTVKDFTAYIIPNGIDVQKYKFTRRGLGKNLAFLGNLSSKKGPMLLIHAFYELLEKTSEDYNLAIAGVIQDPRFGLYLSHMIEEMELQERVQFHGFVTDVEAWLEDKNYILCTSPLESQGLGIMEAMSMGIKPVIHNFVGAKNIYDEKYLWTTISEFIEKVWENEYDSLEYRNFISQHYLLEDTMKKIMEVVDSSPKKKATMIPPIPSQTKDYSEFEYWNKRTYPTDPNMEMETNKRHIDYIRKHVVGSKSVLDFGPGIGRTFEAYEGIPYVEGCDISRLYENTAKKVAKEVGFDFKLIHLDLSEVGKLPYRKKQFDVAVASEVLLHQRPENILKVMRELVRVARKVVVISWGEDRVPFRIPGDASEGPNHCFHYDYRRICQDEYWAVKDFQAVDRQVYFVYEKGGKK